MGRIRDKAVILKEVGQNADTATVTISSVLYLNNKTEMYNNKKKETKQTKKWKN